MSFFAVCGNIQQTFLTMILLGTALLQLFLVIEDVADRRYLLAPFDSILLTVELLFAGILFAAMDSADGIKKTGGGAAVLGAAEVVVLCCSAVRYAYMRKKMRCSLSRGSIKEGGDNLPDGICFFDRHGTVRLINRKMMSLEMILFGREIQTLDELRGALANPPPEVACLDSAVLLYRFPDGTVWRFTESAAADRDGEQITEVTASDVTKLYEKQAELHRESALLADANKRMKWLLDNMTGIVREEEILSMKIRVHDDIGHNILAAKNALLQQQDIAVIRQNAVLWETAVDRLYRANNMPASREEWEVVQERARDLGVGISLNGTLPEDELARHLLLLAVRECVTNCVRHADGNRVCVKVSNQERLTACEITNNGRAPQKAVAEGGGLSTLRRRIEREGGSMELKSTPYFMLSVVLPWGGELEPPPNRADGGLYEKCYDRGRPEDDPEYSGEIYRKV